MSDIFLFPGQGSEAPGMGGATVHRRGPVRTLLERASAALSVDLAELISRGGPALARTELGQPALVAVEIGLALDAVAGGLLPRAVAGHSVGELSAFCLAGCLEAEEAIDCVVERARLMAEAARRSPGAMAALRASEEEARAALALGAGAGALELAAHNGPEEWVFTGDRAALAAVAARYPTVSLPVSGPWHSRQMAGAAEAWRATLRRVGWRRPRVPLVANATGSWVGEDADLPELLAGQLTQPVRWAETMRTLAEGGEARWHLFGPGRVLRGICRANLGAATVLLHDDAVPARELHP